MDKKYIEIFKELAHINVISAKKVMDYDTEIDNKAGYEAAQILHDNFEDLYNRINDEYSMTKADGAKLLICTIIQLSQLQDQVKQLNQAITVYENDLIPKLQDIVDNSQSDEEVAKKANEQFIIVENKTESTDGSQTETVDENK